MKVKEIEAKIGTLSNPSKMPSYAWGIPIEYCVTGSKLAEIEGTICNNVTLVRAVMFFQL